MRLHRAWSSVQVDARHFEDRDTGIGRQCDAFGETLVGLSSEGDVERGRRNTGAQAFQDRVSTQYRLDVVFDAFDGPARLRLKPLGGRMVGPHVRRRSGDSERFGTGHVLH